MMRFIKFICWTILLVIASSCQKSEVTLLFGETPEERMNAKIDSINTALVSAEFGWNATVGTGLKGGYAFYFQFDDKQVVNMVGDLNSTTSKTMNGSNYRVKQDNGAMLVFDTFNYISMLNDPNPNVFGGTVREGLRSDLEFGFRESKGDTLVFVGKRYRNELVMVKAKKEESDSFKAGALQTAIGRTSKFFTDNSNPYIEVTGQDGSFQMALTLATSTKIFELASLLPDGTTSAAKGKFAYSLKGIEVIDGGLPYRGITLRYGIWENDKFYMVDSKGGKYEVKNSLQPLLPLYKLIGSKYVGFRSPYLTYFPGTSPEGLTILKRFHEGLANGATGYTFNSGYMDLGFDVLNKRMTFGGASSQSNGSSHWVTTIVYNYTLDDATGIYTFTLRDAASGGYTSAIMNLMHDFLLKSRVRFDYFVADGVLYGKMIGVDRPNVEITFRLR